MTEIIYAPVSGTVKDITSSTDDVFAQKILGDGILVEPNSDYIYSPVSGTIQGLQNTLHALTIKTDSGNNLLLHCGIDTVEMNGKPFKAFIKNGDHVNVGDKLLYMNRKEVTEAGHSDEILIIFPETSQKIDKQEKNTEVLYCQRIAQIG